MKIIIFGTGQFYQNRKNKITGDIEIVAFIDNDPDKWGTYLDGKQICSISEIASLSFDRVILMSIRADEMSEQLIKLGVVEEKIWYWSSFYADIQRGCLKLYCKGARDKKKKKVLLIAVELGYNGSSVVAVHAIQILQKKNYEAILAAPEGNKQFIEEMTNEGISIIICPSLRYVHHEELMWIKEFDVVIVNTFPMMVSAYAVSQIRPVLWWIHECSDRYENFYESTRRLFADYAQKEDFSNINVIAVSNKAQQVFNSYYPNTIEDTLMFGIPDRYIEQNLCKKRSDTLIFAVIGNVCERKAQRTLLDAVQLLSEDEKQNAEFWIIGKIPDNFYGKVIHEISEKNVAVKILGEMTREEIDEVYSKIDVVVCSSLEETMSITIIEGMMYGRVCITTDETGIAEFITDGENGFVCEAGNVEALRDKVQWILKNKEELTEIGKKARDTYECYFTLESFGNRLEKTIRETEEKYAAQERHDGRKKI